MKALVYSFFALLAGGAFQTTPPAVRATAFTSGLQSPVAFVQDPADRAVFFAVEQGGRIRVVRNRVVSEDLLDLRAAIASGGERGLLGLALAPNFTSTGRFYVNFTDRNGDTVVARFQRGASGAVDPASRFDLKWGPERSPVIAQPYANHNGGNLAFGSDGYLYIGLGDGGSGNDPEHRAQDLTSLLGKMLRINVNVGDDHPSGYVVPPDNPFVSRGGGVRPEIWSIGLRNPWRYSFDDPRLGGNGALVIGDVGQNSWEEIDYEPAGAAGRNYGWRNREGAHPNVQTLPAAFLPLVDPIHEYGRTLGQSVTGGMIYRGRQLGNEYRGRYFFADYVTGRVWSLGINVVAGGEGQPNGVIDHTAEMGGFATTGNISSFGVDADGELFIVSHSRGMIFRLTGDPPSPSNLHIIR